MSRTQSVIYNEIQAEKATLSSLAALQPAADDAQTLANDLTSGSRVGIHRLIEWVISYVMMLHEQLWDAFKAWMIEQEATIHYGTAPWWHKSILAFQYGDSLQWTGSAYAYAAMNPANQIVKRCAIEDVAGEVRIKVAKLDGGGDPTPLTAGEANSLETYSKKIRPAGTILKIINLNTDLLQVHYTVYYDPLVMAADGSLISDSGTKPVEEAITSYLSDLPFNGVVNLTQLTDAIQQATGVNDPVLTDAKAKASTDSAWTDITVEWNTVAGYIKVDDAGYPLSATLNYIADV